MATFKVGDVVRLNYENYHYAVTCNIPPNLTWVVVRVDSRDRDGISLVKLKEMGGDHDWGVYDYRLEYYGPSKPRGGFSKWISKSVIA